MIARLRTSVCIGLSISVVGPSMARASDWFASPSGTGATSGFATAEFPDNTYFGLTRPTGVNVFVRPNLYETKRAHIVIYNWDLESAVEVNVSSVLAAGDAFEVRNAADFFAAPVLTGTYTGDPISLPMTGLSVAAPVGVDAPAATGPEFNVFVLLPGADAGDPDSSIDGGVAGGDTASGGCGCGHIPGSRGSLPWSLVLVSALWLCWVRRSGIRRSI